MIALNTSSEAIALITSSEGSRVRANPGKLCTSVLSAVRLEVKYFHILPGASKHVFVEASVYNAYLVLIFRFRCTAADAKSDKYRPSLGGLGEDTDGGIAAQASRASASLPEGGVLQDYRVFDGCVVIFFVWPSTPV